MNSLQDQQQRIIALNPERSFIVQAPAGSGKTTLLTQRFLGLLSRVKAPEEILAITFTKKAAAEMRNRVLEALESSRENYEPLLKNPNRLQIKTIDSLCFSLASQMPSISELGGQPTASDHPDDLYREAAQETLNQINDSPWSSDIKTLLLHLDNRFDHAEKLLINMLKKRDQWMGYLDKDITNDYLSLKTGLEAVNDDAIEQCKKTVPAEWLDEVLSLAHYAQTYAKIFDCPIESLNTKQEWLGVATLLLTKENTWRKSATIKIGFPAPSTEAKNSDEKKHFTTMKKRFDQLMVALQSHNEFLDALISLRHAPLIDYSDEQKKILTALLKILPLCIANLKVAFQKNGLVDYTEIAQAANLALGETENPTDLALSLDYKIQHILVDEFQDTSISQFKLIEKLTAGWQPDDGRTLFCVGDPMQSIYKFRNAEVGLFLRAQQEGIGHIALEKITLSSNFRSEKSIIDWVNQTFENIFPTVEDIAAGAVSYAKSTPGHVEKNASENGGVYHHMSLQAIIEIIQQKSPQESLAILVKARSHLNKIIPLLRQHNIPYQAIEIDQLANKPCIQDLLSLTKALLHPADRVSWLSLLRAPFCGLTLNSLLQIAEQDSNRTIYDSLNLTLNNTGDQTRLNHFNAIVDQAFACRFDKTLREWIESTWRNFQGHHCLLPDNESIVDADIFFNELENFDLKTMDLFELRIKELRASTQEIDKNAIQIMTIHKAKGLEFDIVILPGLEHTSRPPENQLLRWAERPRTHRENDLILAPIKAFKDNEDDSINRYLKFEEKLKTQLEDQRQFYVAATRAKKQLHLVAEIKESKKSPSNGFLSMIWPQFNAILSLYSTTESDESLPKLESSRPLRRFKTFAPRPEYVLNQPCPQTHIAETASCHKKIGTMIHRVLQQVANEGLDRWPLDRTEASRPAWKTALIRLGILKNELEPALEKVVNAIKNTLNDEKGRWILLNHKDAQSELPITVIEKNKPKNYIIDRTFIDEKGTRWIIDFKCTETDLDEDTIENYRQQLKNYGQIIHQLYGEKDIKIALYFPLSAEIIYL